MYLVHHLGYSCLCGWNSRVEQRYLLWSGSADILLCHCCFAIFSFEKLSTRCEHPGPCKSFGRHLTLSTRLLIDLIRALIGIQQSVVQSTSVYSLVFSWPWTSWRATPGIYFSLESNSPMWFSVIWSIISFGHALVSTIVVSLRSATTMLNILPLSLGKHRYAFVRRNSNDQHPRCAVQHSVIANKFPVSLHRGILWITDRYVQGEIVLLNQKK